jgi:hypothetical protein
MSSSHLIDTAGPFYSLLMLVPCGAAESVQDIFRCTPLMFSMPSVECVVPTLTAASAALSHSHPLPVAAVCTTSEQRDPKAPQSPQWVHECSAVWFCFPRSRGVVAVGHAGPANRPPGREY